MSSYLPLQYKLPGYIGDARLILLGLIINLYLIHKLGRFSREEIWLDHELEMAKMGEELPGGPKIRSNNSRQEPTVQIAL
jgi:hypothetical protein